MADELGGIVFPKDDGFRSPNKQDLIWVNQPEQNVFYLHGALHIFENAITYKLKYEQSSDLITQVNAKITESKYPIVVLEGDSSQKMKKINDSSFLRNSYKQLKELTGALCIIGHSLGDSDAHIIEAVNESNVTKIIIGHHENTADGNLKNKFPKKEVIFFKSKEAFNWKS